MKILGNSDGQMNQTVKSVVSIHKTISFFCFQSYCIKILKEESDEKGSQPVAGEVLQEPDPHMRYRVHVCCGLTPIEQRRRKPGCVPKNSFSQPHRELWS